MSSSLGDIHESWKVNSVISGWRNLAMRGFLESVTSWFINGFEWNFHWSVVDNVLYNFVF